MNKIGYFEGLRGIAALVVVNEHLLKLFFFMAFSDATLRSSGFGVLEELSFPPFNMLHNGAWAVCVFFVLSGYVLSHSFFTKANSSHRELGGKILARYFRLALPITASLLLVWVVMALGYIHFTDVADITKSLEENHYSTPASLFDMIKQGFGSALFLNDYAYNPPLWTMSVEMIGSIGIFVLQGVFLTFIKRPDAWMIRMLIYTALIIFSFSTLYVGFVLGMMLCDCKNNKNVDAFLTKYSKLWVPLSLVVGVVFCSYMIRGLYTNPFRFITISEFHPYYEYLYNTWGAFFLIAGITYSKSISTVLSKPIFLALGKISFPLYLVHFTVMNSLTAYLYLTFPIDDHYFKALAAMCISIPVMFMVAYIFGKVVEAPSVLIGVRIRKIFGSSNSKNHNSNQLTPITLSGAQ